MLVHTHPQQQDSQSPKGGNSPDVHQQVNKQSVVHPHNGILLSRKEEGSTDTRYNVGEPQKHDDA